MAIVYGLSLTVKRQNKKMSTALSGAPVVLSFVFWIIIHVSVTSLSVLLCVTFNRLLAHLSSGKPHARISDQDNPKC